MILLVIVGASVREMPRNLEELTAVDAPVSEAEINVVGTGLVVLKYPESGDPQYRERVENVADDFKEELAVFEALDLTQEESDRAEELGELFEVTSSSIEEATIARDASRTDLNRFLELRADMEPPRHWIACGWPT